MSFVELEKIDTLATAWLRPKEVKYQDEPLRVSHRRTRLSLALGAAIIFLVLAVLILVSQFQNIPLTFTNLEVDSDCQQYWSADCNSVVTNFIRKFYDGDTKTPVTCTSTQPKVLVLDFSWAQININQSYLNCTQIIDPNTLQPIDPTYCGQALSQLKFTLQLAFVGEPSETLLSPATVAFECSDYFYTKCGEVLGVYYASSIGTPNNYYWTILYNAWIVGLFCLPQNENLLIPSFAQSEDIVQPTLYSGAQLQPLVWGGLPDFNLTWYEYYLYYNKPNFCTTMVRATGVTVFLNSLGTIATLATWVFGLTALMYAYCWVRPTKPPNQQEFSTPLTPYQPYQGIQV